MRKIDVLRNSGDNPNVYADGQFFTPPYNEPKTTLLFYPRGVAAFGWLE